MKSLFAFTLGANHPSARMRIAAYADALLTLGWRLRLHPFDPGMGKSLPRAGSTLERARRRLVRARQTARAKSVLRQLEPHEPIIISRELPVSRRPFLNAPNPLVLDVDDALYLGPGHDHLMELCQRASVVVCGNQTIAGELAKYTRRCVIIPTLVDTGRYRVRPDYDLPGPFRLGWLGSSMSCEQALMPLMAMLAEIQRELAFELVVISDERPGFLDNLTWARFVKWSPAIEVSIANHFDAGIMPLQDNPFQRAKCGAKLLQYMAAGLPVIASPVGVNCELVVNDRNGFLAGSPGDWHSAIQQLASQSMLRADFGRAGREHVVKNYSIVRWAGEWAAVLDGLSPG